MLILTRRIGELLKIIIPSEILKDNEDLIIDIDVLGITKSQVKLGTTAPKNIAVHREEIWQRIKNEKENDKS